MARIGLEHNIDNIDTPLLQQFIMDSISTKKCLIVASGIKNNKDYVDLVKEHLGDVLPVARHQYGRQSSEYIVQSTGPGPNPPRPTSLSVSSQCPGRARK
jgi:hypothetical protein